MIVLLGFIRQHWEELKTTFLLLILIPLIIFMLLGIISLFDKYKFKRRIVQLIIVLLLLFLSISFLSKLEFEQDMRWYIRFPHAVNSESGLEVLSEDMRKSWQFFHTPESPEEYDYQRDKLTKANLLPTLYQPLILNRPDSEGLFGKNMTVLAIWQYIYE